jgi:hypothetical protein
MHSRTFLTLLLAVLALAAVACGDSEPADSDSDVNELLEATFSGTKAIESGRISLALDVSSEGEPLVVKVSGPFQSQGKGRLPQLDVDASLEGGGQNLSGGLITTADQAFVTIGDSTYEVAGPVYEQFKASYEQSAKESSDKQDQSLASLGLDPRRWLTNAKNEGESKVGETETIKITGDVDVPKLLDDVSSALERVRSLGIQGADQIPDKLTDAEKREAAEAIDELSVEIHTGADDRILRRMVISMVLAGPDGQEVDARFDLQLQEVNEEQEIEAPGDAKSFDELLSQFEGLGLGGLGSLGGADGAGAGGAAPNVDEYSECVQQAGGDNDKVRKCADLLTTP